MASATPVPSSPVVAVRLLDAVALLQLLFDDVEALVDAVAAEARVARLLPDRFDVVARPHDVLAPDLERVDAQRTRQLVHGAFHGEGGLRGAVAAEAAARDHVGVDDVADALLVRAAIGRDRARHGSGQGLAGMVAVGAGVRHDLHVERGQRAVLLGADLDLGRHLVPRRGADELLLAGPFPFHRPAAELHAGEQRQVFRHHLLLAAEAAADALGEDMDLRGGYAHQVGELGADRERALRAGAHVPAAVLALVGDRAVGLEVHVLHARRRVGHSRGRRRLP